MGDAALTRRARKVSGPSAVVVRFNRTRRRYERQGTLVEEKALDRAERECLADEDSWARRRLREQARRAEQDGDLRARATTAIRRLYPGRLENRAVEIVRHAFKRGNGRVRRTARGRDLDPETLVLAVAAIPRGTRRFRRKDRPVAAGPGVVPHRSRGP